MLPFRAAFGTIGASPTLAIEPLLLHGDGDIPGTTERIHDLVV